MTWKPPTSGALDDTDWPKQLIGRAVKAGEADDQLHGYAVLDDLAQHYRYSDLVYLAVVGELPNERASQLFHVALCAWSTMSVQAAPTHVAVLSRISAGRLGSAVAAGVIALADQTRLLLERYAPLLDWLRAADEPLPTQFVTPGESSILITALANVGAVTHLVRPDMSREAAGLALLFEAGIQTPDRLQAVIMAARANSVIAESLVTGPHDLGSYPVKLPPFHYVDEVAP